MVIFGTGAAATDYVVAAPHFTIVCVKASMFQIEEKVPEPSGSQLGAPDGCRESQQLEDNTGCGPSRSMRTPSIGPTAPEVPNEHPGVNRPVWNSWRSPR